jgi:hypothetical protein
MPGFKIPIGIFSDNCNFDDIGNVIESELPHNIEPARSYRFRLRIPYNDSFQLYSDGFIPPSLSEIKGIEYFDLACESIDRPVPRMLTERVWNGANYINIPLRLEYDPINVSLYEIITDDEENPRNITSEVIYKWWTSTVFDIIRLKSHPPEFRRQDIVIEHLNGLGKIIWTYILHDCYPLIVNPSQLSYRTNEIATTQLQLNFDAAEQL